MDAIMEVLSALLTALPLWKFTPTTIELLIGTRCLLGKGLKNVYEFDIFFVDITTCYYEKLCQDYGLEAVCALLSTLFSQLFALVNSVNKVHHIISYLASLFSISYRCSW